ncbi:MAG: Gfo/Idh/MocA family oxidoreductase [Bryobacteraceae bacterium]|nr:Gfo/Idh/MocA family oxidoreductase [Bryobacteraceae bacterium]
MQLKVAIVGCGKIADGHVEEIQKMPERACVVAACDRELLIAEQLCMRYGIPAKYDDFTALLEREKPDVVHITTPPQSHLALTKQSIDAGCHVFVEKPFAMNLAETREMLDYAEAHRKKVTLGYRTFFDPPALAMRRLVAEGVIGEPVHLESHYGYDLTGQFGQALISDPNHWVHKLPGKLFHNIIDHLLNKVVEFIPDDEPEVIVHASSIRPQKFGDSRDLLKDELRLMIHGERVTAFGTFSSHIRPVRESLRLYGTKNTAHIDWGMRAVTLEAVGKLPSAIGRLVPPFDMARSYFREGMRNVWKFAKADFHYFAGMHTLIARFYDSILHDLPVPYAYRDIIRVSRLLDQIFSRIEQGHETRAFAVGAGR